MYGNQSIPTQKTVYQTVVNQLYNE